MDAGHGIVQMGQVGSTGIISGFGVVVVRVGMGDRNGAKLLGLPDELFSAGKLRGHVHDPNQTAAAIVQSLKAFEIRLL